MFRKAALSKSWRLSASPWIIIGSVAILLAIVIVQASQNFSREKKYMSRILSEKGIALIKTVEAGARTGMMGMQWGGRQVQTLLEETSRLHDVLFLAVVDQNGSVLAHSDKARVGSRFDLNPAMIEPRPTDDASWELIQMNDYGRSFVVYSQFRPISTSTGMMNRRSMMHGRGMMMEPSQDWCFQSSNDAGDRIILVGLNPKPFDAGRKEDIRNTMIIAGVLVVLGLAGFISMFWMNNYRITKQALQDTTAFADEVVTSLPVGLIATDKDGKIAFYNSAAERISGIDFSQALGKDPESVLPIQFCGLKETLNLGETISEEEMECEFSKGKIVPLSISASSIINEEGHGIGQVMIMRDLGEIRRLQAEIRRKEKLAAIGGLAAGVAHEIRNPLSSIKGIASYFKAKFTEGSDDQEMAGVMIEEVDRLSRVISELLEFARPMKLNLRLSNVNELLEHSVLLVQQEASSRNVQISFNTAPDPMMANVDSDRLTQCLLNLYLNALQAMEGGGQLSISGFVQDRRLKIDIQDTGSGIEAENLYKIFDPYFTTKPKGTGLGLAIVHNVIEAHEGSVKVRSTPGHGTVFTILLPINPTV